VIRLVPGSVPVKSVRESIADAEAAADRSEA
jgi:hypothetical protein